MNSFQGWIKMSYSLIEDEGTQLCDAIFSGEPTDVQVLIDTGVDINSINKVKIINAKTT